jgi:hypothetical protein
MHAIYNATRVWSFQTKNYTVAFDVLPEEDLDLSWDETGVTLKRLMSGQYVAFVAHVTVTHASGALMGDSSLGNCVYESPEAFMNHRGVRACKNSGSYFSDMVREAIAEARKTASTLRLREVA